MRRSLAPGARPNQAGARRLAASLFLTAAGSDHGVARPARLGRFLLISAAVHAGLLLAHGAATTRIDAGRHSEVIAVSLDGSDAGAVRKSAPKPARRAPAAGTALVAPRPQDVAIKVARDTSAATGPPDDRQRTEPGAEEAAAHVRALVLTDLARYFYYPAIARAKGWQGRVILAFRISPDGELQAARVARTSGFAMLDDAALHSLRKVERIRDAAAWLADRRLDLQVPVVYQLTDAR